MDDPSDRHAQEKPGTAQAALFGLCPDCGSQTLFAGTLRFADHCTKCGLDFTRYNVGDGPAAFLTLIIGASVIALAILLEVAAHPPFWVHAIIWISVTVAAVIYGTRAAKAALLITEHRRGAREGRIDDSDGAEE